MKKRLREQSHVAGQDDVIAKLKVAVEGLTYPSESDEPFDVVRWDNPGGLAIQAVVGQHAAKGRKIKQVSVDDFFAALKDSDDVERYVSLRKTLESVTRGLRVFRVGEGEVRVDVYVVGNSTDGRSVVGVHTVSVET